MTHIVSAARASANHTVTSIRACLGLVLIVLLAATTGFAANRSTFVRTDDSLGSDSRSMVFDAVHRRVFAINPALNRIEVISSQSRTLTDTIDIPAPTSIDISPDNSRLAVATETGFLYLVDTAALELCARVPFPGLSGHAVWSPTIHDVVFTTNNTVLVRLPNDPHQGGAPVGTWDLTSNTFTALPLPSFVSALARSGDHSKVLLADTTYHFELYDSGSATIIAQGSYSIPVRSVAANQDGTRFAVYLQGGYPAVSEIVLLDVSFNEIARQPVLGFDSMLFSADSHYLYVTQGSGPAMQVEVWNASDLSRAGYVPDIAPANTQSHTRLQGTDDSGMLFGASRYGIAFLDASSYSTPVNASPNLLAPVAVSPNLGRVGQTTATRLEGNNFDLGMNVYFGTAAALVTALDVAGHAIWVNAPPSSTPGPVNVSVQGTGTFALAPDAFSYGPYLRRAVDTVGPPAGGQTVELMGYFGSGPVQVQVGGTSAGVGSVPLSPHDTLSMLMLSTIGYWFPLQEVSFTAPPGVAGLADITVSTAEGSFTLPRAYQYLAKSKVFALSGNPSFLHYDAGRNRVYISNQMQVEVFDVASEQFLTPLTPTGGAPAGTSYLGLTLTPDGKTVVVADKGGAIHLLDPNQPGTGTVVDAHSIMQSSWPALVAATSSGKLLIVMASSSSCASGALYLLDLATGTFSQIILPGGSTSIGPLVQAADGGRKAFIFGYGPGAVLWDDATNAISRQALAPVYSDLGVAADGTAAVSGGGGSLGYTAQHFVFDGELRAQARARLDYMVPEYGVWRTPGLAMHASGALIYQPLTSGYPAVGKVDIMDAHYGYQHARLTLPEAPKSACSLLAGRFLTTDGTGRVLFALTQSGLTVVELAHIPLAVGSCSPEFGAPAGGNTVIVRGSGFDSATTVTLGPATVPATFVDETTLTFTVPALPAGAYSLKLGNNAGEQYTLAGAYRVVGPRPTPVITAITPSPGLRNTTQTSITLTGSNFAPDSLVFWNRGQRLATWNSPTQMTATLDLWDLRSTGTAKVTVYTPDGGGVSLPFDYPVENPVPLLSAIYPAHVLTGSGDLDLGLAVANWVEESVVRWNGTDLVTSRSSPGYLRAQVPASLLASDTTAQITVFNPAPGGGESNALPLVVNAATVLIDIRPSPLDLGTLPPYTSAITKYIGIRNVGTANLMLSNFHLNGAGFHVYPDGVCYSPLASNYLCLLIVNFQSGEPGNYSGTFTFDSNAPGSPHTIVLSAEVVAMPPLVTQASVGSIAATSATLTASVDPRAPNGTAWFEFGTSSTLATYTATPAISLTSNGGVSQPVTGLTPGTRYYYRVAASNAYGTDRSAIASFQTLVPDFALSHSPSVTVALGQTATYNLTLTGNNGFNGTVALTCSGVPLRATCTITPSAPVVGAAPVPFRVEIKTTVGNIAAHRSPAGLLAFVFVGGAFLVARGRRRAAALAIAGLLLLVLVWVGCGGGGGSTPAPQPQLPGTPLGSSTITVTGTSGNISHSTQLQLIIN